MRASHVTDLLHAEGSKGLPRLLFAEPQSAPRAAFTLLFETLRIVLVLATLGLVSDLLSSA